MPHGLDSFSVVKRRECPEAPGRAGRAPASGERGVGGGAGAGPEEAEAARELGPQPYRSQRPGRQSGVGGVGRGGGALEPGRAGRGPGPGSRPGIG